MHTTLQELSADHGTPLSAAHLAAFGGPVQRGIGKAADFPYSIAVGAPAESTEITQEFHNLAGSAYPAFFFSWVFRTGIRLPAQVPLRSNWTCMKCLCAAAQARTANTRLRGCCVARWRARRRPQHLLATYYTEVFKCATADLEVAHAMWRVSNMIDSFGALLAPRIVLKVLASRLRRWLGGAGSRVVPAAA